MNRITADNIVITALEYIAKNQVKPLELTPQDVYDIKAENVFTRLLSKISANVVGINAAMPIHGVVSDVIRHAVLDELSYRTDLLTRIAPHEFDFRKITSLSDDPDCTICAGVPEVPCVKCDTATSGGELIVYGSKHPITNEEMLTVPRCVNKFRESSSGFFPRPITLDELVDVPQRVLHPTTTVLGYVTHDNYIAVPNVPILEDFKGIMQDDLMSIFGDDADLIIGLLETRGIAIAGGFVSGVLRERDSRAVKDLDIFIYGITEVEAKSIIVRFIQLAINSGVGIRVSNTQTCVTIQGFSIPIQFIKRIYPSHAYILYGFDIGAACVSYCEGNVHMTPTAVYAFKYNVFPLNLHMFRSSFIERNIKYMQEKGFQIAMPELDTTNVVGMDGYDWRKSIQLTNVIICYTTRDTTNTANYLTCTLSRTDRRGKGEGDYGSIYEDSERAIPSTNVRNVINGRDFVISYNDLSSIVGDVLESDVFMDNVYVSDKYLDDTIKRHRNKFRRGKSPTSYAINSMFEFEPFLSNPMLKIDTFENADHVYPIWKETVLYLASKRRVDTTWINVDASNVQTSFGAAPILGKDWYGESYKPFYSKKNNATAPICDIRI
jgi:hypothetical protein